MTGAGDPIRKFVLEGAEVGRRLRDSEEVRNSRRPDGGIDILPEDPEDGRPRVTIFRKVDSRTSGSDLSWIELARHRGKIVTNESTSTRWRRLRGVQG